MFGVGGFRFRKLPHLSAALGVALACLSLTSGAPASSLKIVPVVDADPGANGSEPDALVGLDGQAYFVADDGGSRRLWVTDGKRFDARRVCPRLIRDVRDTIAATEDLIVFGVDEPGPPPPRLWRTDGTCDGTRPISGAPIFDYRMAIGLDDSVVYSSAYEDGIATIWATDGTARGTKLLWRGRHRSEEKLKEIARAGDHAFLRLELVGTPYYPSVYFATDGTRTGTKQIVDEPAVADEGIIGSRGEAWFVTGDQLWRSDGSPRGTRPFSSMEFIGSSDLEPYRGGVAIDSYVEGAESWIPGIWRTTGRKGGERLEPVWVNEPGLRIVGLTRVGDRLLFFDRDEKHGYEPFVVGGDLEKGGMLADLNPGPAGSVIQHNQFYDGVRPLAYRESAVFPGFVGEDDSTFAPMAWITDGTPSGTKRIRGLPSAGMRLELVSGKIYLRGTVAESHPLGEEVWVLRDTRKRK